MFISSSHLEAQDSKGFNRLKKGLSMLVSAALAGVVLFFGLLSQSSPPLSQIAITLFLSAGMVPMAFVATNSFLNKVSTFLFGERNITINKNNQERYEVKKNNSKGLFSYLGVNHPYKGMSLRETATMLVRSQLRKIFTLKDRIDISKNILREKEIKSRFYKDSNKQLPKATNDKLKLLKNRIAKTEKELSGLNEAMSKDLQKICRENASVFHSSELAKTTKPAMRELINNTVEVEYKDGWNRPAFEWDRIKK